MDSSLRHAGRAKPHLFKAWGRWYCHGGHRIGSGYQPLTAYLDWQARR
jgi:hypothetical protein